MTRKHILAAALALAGCAHVPPAERIVTRDVLVPYYQPCPRQADIPVAPKTVHEEHSVMPDAPTPKDRADVAGWIAALNASHARERILADKVLEDRTYIERSQGVMGACARPTPPK